METRAGVVLQTFYRLRSERNYKTPSHFTKPMWAAAEKFLAWCKKQEIDDPLGFIRYRLECADHTGYVLPLKSLCSDKLAEQWRTRAEGHQLEDDAYKALVLEAGSSKEQLVKSLMPLTRGHEAMQAHYAQTGQSELCMAEIDLSGGFHPNSRFCPTCPSAVRCAAALYQKHGFDVVSLRAGRLHAVPREVAAAAAR